jgi:hypothetical protein
MLASIGIGSSVSSASPVLWTLTGVNFSDGGTASGSFIYDADTNTYSDIDIVTTSGSAQGGATYTVVNPLAAFGPAPTAFMAATTFPFLAGSPGMSIGFEALTDDGGTILPPFLLITEGTYNSGLNTYLEDRSSLGTSGTLTGVAVPEPAAAVLFTIGLLVLFGLKFRSDLLRYSTSCLPHRWIVWASPQKGRM